MTQIKKAVIAAAGLGTRFLPATKSQPKEMLPVVDKPSIQYIVEEVVASGITEIIVVTGKNKRSIEDHFDFSFELSEHLKRKGKTKALQEISKIEQLANLIYIRQPYPKGDGDAILCAKEFLGDEPFAVLFGDVIYDSATPPLSQMIQQFNKHQTPIVGLHKIQKEESDKYGIASGEKITDNLLNIKGFIEKPDPKDAPSDLAATGKYILTPEVLETLSTANSHTKDGEIRLADAIINHIQKQPVYGHVIQGQRFDTGDKLGYLQAVIHFGLKHPELKDQFKKHLQSLDLS